MLFFQSRPKYFKKNKKENAFLNFSIIFEMNNKNTISYALTTGITLFGQIIQKSDRLIFKNL